MPASVERRTEAALVADIGGTNARFAVADLATLALSDVRIVSCAEHPSLSDAARSYLAGLKQRPRLAAIAVAAPVTGEAIRFTNSTWSFERESFRGELEFEDVLILNDFEALARSLPYLGDEALIQIGGDRPIEHGTKVVLGPGTGLGAAGLVWSPSGWIAIAGEGGHVTLASPQADQFALVERLLSGRGHVSAERVISGPGLTDLYRAVAEHRGKPPQTLPPGNIVAHANAKDDPIAVETLDHFIAWLGSFAGDAALFFGARGGVYLGGGIAAKIIDRLKDGSFGAAFEAKGRMRSFLHPIPRYVITDEKAALKGAAAALRAARATQVMP